MAIKILPETFAADPDRLARFEREAKTLASLDYKQRLQRLFFRKDSRTTEIDSIEPPQPHPFSRRGQPFNSQSARRRRAGGESNGEPARNRTENQQIKSLLLCQLSYGPT